jgi:hypothetical protein
MDMVAHCGWSVAGNQRLQLDRIRFETVWAFVQEWLTEEPTATAKELFQRVQASMPGLFTDAQLITLQRRVKQWRAEIARRLALGVAGDTYPGVADSGQELLK